MATSSDLPPLSGEMLDRKRCSLREQLGNSRTQSGGVVRCRRVFRREWVNSLRKNPAYRRSRPTFCIPKASGLRAADCGHSFTSRIGAGPGGLDRTVRLNSKSLANVLCAQYRRFKEDALAMRPSEAFLVSPR